MALVQVAKPASSAASPAQQGGRRSSGSGASYGEEAAVGASWDQTVLPVYNIAIVAARAMCKYKVRGLRHLCQHG